MSTALTHAAEAQQSGENGRISLEGNHKRIRVFFAGHVVADTTRQVYLFEEGHLPVYYLPPRRRVHRLPRAHQCHHVVPVVRQGQVLGSRRRRSAGRAVGVGV